MGGYQILELGMTGLKQLQFFFAGLDLGLKSPYIRIVRIILIKLRYLRKGESELFELDTYPSLALELVNGNIAGFVCDYAVGMGMVASNDKLEVANFTFSSEEASFGKACVVAKGNEDFLEVVNKVIDKVVEDGSYLEKFNEYNAIWSGEENN